LVLDQIFSKVPSFAAARKASSTFPAIVALLESVAGIHDCFSCSERFRILGVLSRISSHAMANRQTLQV
jgi:hypothetical protein